MNGKSSGAAGALIGPVITAVIILLILWKTGKLGDILFSLEGRFGSLSRKLRNSALSKKLSEPKRNRERYEKAARLLETGENDEALAVFQSLSEKNYRDSAVMADRCREAIERKKREKRCRDALASMDAGRFVTALNELEKISDQDASYRDKYLECRGSAEQAADRSLEAGEFREALDLFTALAAHGAPDAEQKRERCREALYQSAAALAAEGRFREAAECLSPIAGYRDSRALLADCSEKARQQEYRETCDLAMERAAAGDVDGALDLLERLPKVYRDIKPIYRELAYKKAVSCMERGAFKAAMDWFKKLPEDYKDSSSLYRICIERENASRVNIAFESDDELKRT